METTETIQFKPRQCMWCDTPPEVITLDKNQYYKWIGGGSSAGEHIQNAFPDLDASQREILLTGTHAECWDNVFGDEE